MYQANSIDGKCHSRTCLTDILGFKFVLTIIYSLNWGQEYNIPVTIVYHVIEV